MTTAGSRGAREREVKLAVIGGGRGGAFIRCAEQLSPRLRITAICDPRDDVVERWRESVPGIEAFSEIGDALRGADCNAVLVSTPMPLHARHSVEAMRAGKDVLSEVIACTTVEEGRELVRTVGETGRFYMMAENCCYMRANMMVLEMARRGVFGEPVYAECGYVHDVRRLYFYDDGTLTWRGELSRDLVGDWYPTHAVGPVAQWMGVGPGSGDAFATAASVTSGQFSRPLYAAERLGPSSPAADPGFWRAGDVVVTLVRTRLGRMISVQSDHASPRPHRPTTRFELRGTAGAYISERRTGEDPLVWIRGRSPGESVDGGAAWEPLWKYADEFEHPLWRDLGGAAGAASHGGSDLVMLADFVGAVLEGRPSPIGVRDAVAWSSLMPVSARSIAAGGAAVEMPDFGGGGGD